MLPSALRQPSEPVPSPTALSLPVPLSVLPPSPLLQPQTQPPSSPRPLRAWWQPLPLSQRETAAAGEPPSSSDGVSAATQPRSRTGSALERRATGANAARGAFRPPILAAV